MKIIQLPIDFSSRILTLSLFALKVLVLLSKLSAMLHWKLTFYKRKRESLVDAEI